MDIVELNPKLDKLFKSTILPASDHTAPLPTFS